MDNSGSNFRGWPGPDTYNIKNVVRQLETALNEENKDMANLLALDELSIEDSLMARDGTAMKLRFLKIWFELPSEVFLTSMNLLDRFLTKMKVKTTYLACASTSCFYVSTELHKCAINLDELIKISRIRCKVNDVERMSDIIRLKLGLTTGHPPITVYNFIQYYLKILECAAVQLNIKYIHDKIFKNENLLILMEIILLDYRCASIKPSEAALALIQTILERFFSKEVPGKSPYYSLSVYNWLTVIYELQIVGMMIPHKFATSYEKIKSVVQSYEDNSIKREPEKYMRPLRIKQKPSENFSTNLCIISEY